MRTPLLRAIVCIAALMLLLPALRAHAATSAPGVNLRWDRCFGDAGVWNKNFACDSNVGTEHLIGSFELADAAENKSGIELLVDLASASPTLPAWWQFKNVGTCRQTALGFSTAPPANSSACLDWGAGQTGGGIGSYVAGSSGPNRSRLLMAVAVPQSAIPFLNAGQEYFAFSVAITHTKTVGTGSCAGCLEPVCIFFSSARLTDATDASASVLLTRGANFVGSQYATWQNGYPTDVVTGVCGGITGGGLFCQFPQTDFNCVLATPTNSRGSTWGAVKALYR